MNPRQLATLAAATIALASVSSALAAGGSKPIRVTSTLDGKKVLPLRTRWLAYPKVAVSKVTEVDFLIDGKLRWIEHQPPYNYGSDDLHGHLGFLITTWLTPGLHRFTAQVRTTSGQRGTDTVVARVLPAPEPPAELTGTWTRIVPDSGPDAPPAGKWRLIFDRAGAWHLDPLGAGVGNQYDITGDVIRVYAPIQMAPLINDHTTTTRYGARNVGGFDCREDGPFGSYHWRVSAATLTLTPIDERCAARGVIWEGAWTKVA
jgi:hypothetical protein